MIAIKELKKYFNAQSVKKVNKNSFSIDWLKKKKIFKK